MEALGLPYFRFMDDWVILAPTRWKLRKAVRIVNETLDELKVEQHPDKTFIGRVSRGFEFLGYAIATPGIVGVAQKTLEKFAERVTRLYEQGAGWDCIGAYVRRWWAACLFAAVASRSRRDRPCRCRTGQCLRVRGLLSR